MESALGRYIKAKRLAAELSQDDLAERTQFTQPAISAWESGRKVPTAKAIAALARGLPGATVEEMVALADVATETVA